MSHIHSEISSCVAFFVQWRWNNTRCGCYKSYYSSPLYSILGLFCSLYIKMPQADEEKISSSFGQHGSSIDFLNWIDVRNKIDEEIFFSLPFFSKTVTLSHCFYCPWHGKIWKWLPFFSSCHRRKISLTKQRYEPFHFTWCTPMP